MTQASLGRRGWLVAPETQAVLAALDAKRPQASRFVGGCVRNALLGQPVDDLDIATQLTPDQVIHAVEAAGLKAVPTGVEHGTVTVISDGRPYEVTTLRRDVETDGRRAVVAFTEDWDEDAQRRDFRLNALYADGEGQVYDPTGGGLEDLKARRIIFIGDAETRIREDYLRILRFFRFNAWYGAGDLDADGLSACGRLRDGLNDMSAERIWKELGKLLRASDPAPAVTAMAESGVLSAVLLEAASLDRFKALVSLDLDSFFDPDPFQRLGALLPGDPDQAALVAQRLRLSNVEKDKLVAMAEAEPRIVSFLSPKAVRQALYRLGPETFKDRVKLAWAASENPRQTPQWRALLAMAEGYARPAMPLSGEDAEAAGVPPGPLMGEVLREVEDWWVDADFTDDKLSLIERLKSVAQALVPAH